MNDADYAFLFAAAVMGFGLLRAWMRKGTTL